MGQLEVFGEFADELGLLDAVDPEIGFEIGGQFDHLFGVAGLVDDVTDHEPRDGGAIERGRGGSGGREDRRGLRGGGRDRKRRCGGLAHWNDRRGRGPGGLGDEFEDRLQRAEVIERKLTQGAREVGELEILGEFPDELRLLDAVDAEVGLEIGGQFDHLFGIARLVDDVADHEPRDGGAI